jgi:hypothetical protein
MMDAERGSLRQRQEARAEFAKDMAGDPALVAERVGWLLQGNYGKGSYDAAREVARNKRMNRAAWMTMTIGALEWHCPRAFTAAAYNKMTEAQKQRLNHLIEKEISYSLTVE